MISGRSGSTVVVITTPPWVAKGRTRLLAWTTTSAAAQSSARWLTVTAPRAIWPSLKS